MTALALFTQPIDMTGGTLWFALPVGLAVAAVYKTIRTRSLRRLPLEIALLVLYIWGGIAALMVVFWLLVRFWIA